MKQILQNLSTGETRAVDVPAPGVRAGHLLIASTRSLVSTGTERMMVNFGRANFIDKARQQPDKVRQVLDKVRTDGLAPTLQSVRNKLDQPLPMGYSNVGHVVAIGPGVEGFAVGDQVVSNGKHAEVVTVPINLCAKLPPDVSPDAAAFTVVGAIALQGIRLAAPTLGETVAVAGLGLIGLITVQLLKAHGCRVIGLDFDEGRLALTRAFGAQTIQLTPGTDPVPQAVAFSRGRGVDAVLITAATDSNDPVRQAAQMSRKRGRIVLVGVAGLELSRADFYEKELSFQVSCSYGPGRYDPAYEELGQDYPLAFVRWTEQRNFEAVLDMIADGRIDTERLITHRFAIDQAAAAYDVVAGSAPSLGILIDYPGASLTTDKDASQPLLARTMVLDQASTTRKARSDGKPSISAIGAGNYASAVLLPAFKAANANLRTVASSGGVSGAHAARKFGFAQTTTDTDAVFADADTDAIVITTRHDSHARFVLQALRAGKHVFVEKPLCLTLDEVAQIRQAHAHANANGQHCQLMVGFNRRFAPQVQKMKSLLDSRNGPKSFVFTANAGAIPADHWTQDRLIGGGRLIGEACHFVDLLRHLAGAPIIERSVSRMHAKTGDTFTLNLGFGDGSIGTIHYFANGSKAFPKERLEVFAGGAILQLDNFRMLRGFGWPGFKSMRLFRQDKGQQACAKAFVESISSDTNALQNGAASEAPIPMQEILEVAQVVIELSGND